MELSDEDVGLASQITKPKQVELSDADVFGAPAQPVAELSDADVFGTPDAPAMPKEASGMLAGAGSAMVRGYQDTQAQAGIAEKFRLRGYKTALENGGDYETDIGELAMSGEATPAQIDLLRRGVPNTDPVWRQAEIARVTNEMVKLDQSIKDADATIANYPAKSLPYQELQAGIEAAKKEGRPIMGTLESLWNNPAGVPEFVAEGAYGTAKPIAGAIGTALALRRGNAAPLAQTLGPIAVSMGITGLDSYKGEVSQIIEEKARQGGIDLRKNPEMMDGLLTDANFIQAVKTDALKAGLNDAAWAGISTWLGMTPKIKGLWQPVIQSVAEAGTEASKQLVVKGKIDDPSNVIMSGVAGAMFEGPAYGLHGAFAGKAPASPAAATSQAQQQAAVEPQAQTQQANPAPDVIPVESLPSVAGETAEPAPVAVQQQVEPTPSPVQETQTAPVPQAEVAQPAPVETQPAPVAAPAAEAQPAVEPAPAPVAEAKPAEPAPATAAQEAVQTPAVETTPAVGNVEPAPTWPGDRSRIAARNEWRTKYREWRAKYAKTHWEDGTPRETPRPSPAPAVQTEAPAPVAAPLDTTPAPSPTPTAEANPAPSAAYAGGDPKQAGRWETLNRNLRERANVAYNELTNLNKKREKAVTEKRSTKNLDARIAKASAEIEAALSKTDKANPRNNAEINPPQSPQAEATPIVESTVQQTEVDPELAKIDALKISDDEKQKIKERYLRDKKNYNRRQRELEASRKLDEANRKAAEESRQLREKEAAQHAEQQKQEAKPEPKVQDQAVAMKEAAKAQKTDQPQTKRARTALAKAMRDFGRDDARTKKKYTALLDALKREAGREQRARDISQPHLGREEPPDIKAARELLAKKEKRTGGITNFDATKATSLVEQYEAEVDLSMGQLRDEGQIRLVSDDMLNRVIAHVEGMKDAGLRPDADAENALQLAQDEIVRRSQQDNEGFGDPIADVRRIANSNRVKQAAIPLLPSITTKNGSAFGDTEFAGLKENLPPELSKEGGLFKPPGGDVDIERAKKDPEYRKELSIKAEGMISNLGMAMAELGWTQLEDNPMGVIELLQDASLGRPQIPEGGVLGAPFKGDPNAVAKMHGGEVNLDMLASEGKINGEPEVDTRTLDLSEQDQEFLKQGAEEYGVGRERYDAKPDPVTEIVLAEAEAERVSEQSILEALDKAAAERLDPRNANSLGPDLIAALAWKTARDMQNGLTNFAKWAVDTAKKFPALKGQLQAVWDRALQIAKSPMDYIRFRALDSIADKVWQNVRRNADSPTLRKIANIVFAKGGPDANAVEHDIPTRVNLVRAQFSNIYANIMERFAAEFAGMDTQQRRQWDVDFRDAVLGRTQPTDPKMVKAVKDYRNLMRDMLAYQRDAGVTVGDQGENYFPRHYDADAVEANRSGFIDVAMDMYRKRDERLLNKAIADVRYNEKERAANRKQADKEAGRKEKATHEYKAEAAEWADEKIAALEAEHAAKDDDHYKGLAEDWATAITHGDVLGLTLFKNTDGKIKSDATDVRSFSDAEAELADAFLKKNVDDITMGYVDGAVRGAELARVFGEDGKKFEQMMNKLSEEGVDKDTVKETRDLVAKALGVGREQLSQAESVFFDWVNVVLAGAFLGKTFIYNMVLEPISFGVRTGNAYLALKGVAETWKNTIAELSTPSAEMRQRLEQQFGSRAHFEESVNAAVAEQLGLVQKEIERAYLNTHWDYSSDNKGSKTAKWLSQRIYRANMMTATEHAKVRASIAISRLALRDNARFLLGEAPLQKILGKLGMDTRADKSVATIFNENGVPEKDHKAFADWVIGLEGKTDAQWQAAVMGSDPMAKHYRRALQRMSLGMSIKTNPALKMASADSVLGRMLMQLMNYSYAYSNLVKDRMYTMAGATFSKDASKIDRLRYAAPLLVGAPLAVIGAAASKALIGALWPSDEMEEINKKRSFARKAFDAASFAGMFGPKIEYLVKGFERGQLPGGPTAEVVFRGGQAAFASATDPDNAKKGYTFKKQAYNAVVKPAVTGGAAAVHPFFGFLGNTAVNTQGAREAVIGDKPKK